MSLSALETRASKSKYPNQQSFGADGKLSMARKENVPLEDHDAKTVAVNTPVSRIESNTKQGFRKSSNKCRYCQRSLQSVSSTKEIPNADGAILNSKMTTLVMSLISQNQELKKTVELNSKNHLFQIQCLEDKIEDLRVS